MAEFHEDDCCADEALTHKCGVFALSDSNLPSARTTQPRNLVPHAISIGSELVHRGRDAHGIAFPHESGIFFHHGLSNMSTSSDLLLSGRFSASQVIGHTRYPTSYKGTDQSSISDRMKLRNAHPIRAKGKNNEEFAFAFNGNIPQFNNEVDRLKKAGVRLPRNFTDTHVLAELIGLQMRKRIKQSLSDIVRVALGDVDGAHSGVILLPNGEIGAWRDPLGMRPLVVGDHKGIQVVASEDHPLITKLSNNIATSSVKPGEFIHLRPGQEMERIQLWTRERTAHCFFEWIYFAKRLSTLDDVSVVKARTMFGEALAELDKDWTDSRMVVAVPDSARIAAAAYADKTGQPSADLLVRTSADRTFINSGDRAAAVRRKMSTPLADQIKSGAKIVLVDDSIVRGTTLIEIIKMLRETYKPSEIHIRIACPPVLNPCYYGIDMKTMDQLLVRNQFYGSLSSNGVLPEAVLLALAIQLGVNSIKFLPLPAVSTALGLSARNLCSACVDGAYPTPAGQQLYQLERALFDESHSSA